MFLLSRREALLTASATAALAQGGAALAADQAGGASRAASWDLTELFATPAAWETERQAILKAIPTLAAYRGKLGTSAATLKAAAQAMSDLNRRAGRL